MGDGHHDGLSLDKGGDVVLITLTIVFFLIALAYVGACEKLHSNTQLRLKTLVQDIETQEGHVASALFGSAIESNRF
jgi:hypothetical protein